MNQQLINFIKKTVFKFIDANKYKIFIFGSRANNTNTQWSDIDIGIKGQKNIPLHLISQIKGVFENSNLPYFVDIVDFNTIDVLLY